MARPVERIRLNHQGRPFLLARLLPVCLWLEINRPDLTAAWCGVARLWRGHLSRDPCVAEGAVSLRARVHGIIAPSNLEMTGQIVGAGQL
jgi:hypothetical protein